MDAPRLLHDLYLWKDDFIPDPLRVTDFIRTWRTVTAIQIGLSRGKARIIERHAPHQSTTPPAATQA
jgi:hypothetical protein